MLVSRALRLSAVLAAVLALSACSGGSGGQAAPSAAGPTSSATSAPAPSETSSSTGAAGTQDQVVAKFCSDRAELTDLGSQIEAGGLPAAIQRLPEFVQRMDAIQPPDAVKADFTEYRAAWASISDALRDGSPEDPALQAKVQAAVAAHPDAQAVEDRLKTWSDANCPAASTSPSAG